MYKLLFIGFGRVGQGFARILLNKKSLLSSRYNFEYKVVGIIDLIKGSIIDERGIDLTKALDLVSAGKSLENYDGERKGLRAVEAIGEVDSDILIEVTWTNLVDGEPGLTHIKRALERGMHVVTTNKGPIALAYNDLVKLAKSKGVFLKFEGTVMSGTPVINIGLNALAGASITSIEGILNGTTNYILTLMEKGLDYADALRRAQEAGYAEADPTADVEALDPAAKIVILANVLMSGDVKFRDVERIGITGVTSEELMKAIKRKGRIKLIAKAWKEGERVKARVRPEFVPLSDLLAHVSGVMNAVRYSLDVQPDITIIGPGAGGDSAGYAILSDILAIHRELSR